uniref:Uncharacterized protein n=1 Tax=Caenorhabditis japonica TaxID=281687 RepID=A0A8R1ILG4_CAEJA
MKQIVVILLIFLCELGDLSKHDRYVDDVNKRRKEFAKKFKIKNMKNLTWDDALRSKAEDMCDSCGKSRYNDNSRHYYIFYKESKDAVKNYTAYFDGMFDTGKFKEMVDYLNESPKPRINILELYVPTQNKIACSNCLTCPLKLGSLEIKRHVWCLIGPNGNISFSDFVFETSTTTTKLPSTKNGEVFISSGSEAANTTGSVP